MRGRWKWAIAVVDEPDAMPVLFWLGRQACDLRRCGRVPGLVPYPCPAPRRHPPVLGTTHRNPAHRPGPHRGPLSRYHSRHQSPVLPRWLETARFAVGSIECQIVPGGPGPVRARRLRRGRAGDEIRAALTARADDSGQFAFPYNCPLILVGGKALQSTSDRPATVQVRGICVAQGRRKRRVGPELGAFARAA